MVFMIRRFVVLELMTGIFRLVRRGRGFPSDDLEQSPLKEHSRRYRH
jgi:hypothetical protein